MMLKEKIVGNVKKFFKELNVLDYFIYILGIIGVIIASILVKSSAISIVTAVFGVFYVRTLSKKYKISIIFGLIYVGMYIVQSVIYKNWGEVIIYGGLSVPILIWTCVSWYKKSDKVQNHAISWKEWLILLSVVAVLSVGIYFMLWYFATPNLVIAVISSVVGLVGNYLILRQDGKMFFAFMILNLIQILLWTIPIIKGGEGGSLETVPMIISLVAFLASNIDGAISWLKKPKAQTSNDLQPLPLNEDDIKDKSDSEKVEIERQD